MISQRMLVLFTAIFWICSMAWLYLAKIAPDTLVAPTNVHRIELPSQAGTGRPVAWHVQLNELPIGWARYESHREADGSGTATSVVHMEQVKASDLLQATGGVARVLAGLARSADWDLGMTITSKIHAGPFGELDSFECHVTEDEVGDCVRIDGHANGDSLHLRAYSLLGTSSGNIANAPSAGEPIYQTTVQVPGQQAVMNLFSPRVNLGSLRVGQAWTFRGYNPLMPTRATDTIMAEVVERRKLDFHGDQVTTNFVVYTRQEHGGLTVPQPIGNLWVSLDGQVLRQTMNLGAGTICFVRLPDEADDGDDPIPTNRHADPGPTP